MKRTILLVAILLSGLVLTLDVEGQRRKSQRQTQPKPPPSKPAPAPTPASTQAKKHPNKAGIEFVLIPPGSFIMGSTSIEDDGYPPHKVTINYSFFMGKYEVTQAQWQSVMGNNPSYFKDCGGNCPVERVSWNDAQKFINKLNESNDGFTYRLPTEAEWEYACRAGTTGDYSGNLSKMAWYKENSGNRTHAVGGKRPNGWGLYDMHGNVAEWCQDVPRSYYGARTDGSALPMAGATLRVWRGGAWGFVELFVHSATRHWSEQDYSDYYSGFRVVAVARTD